MKAVGRVLQFIGWIWVIAGFVGPILGFDVGSFFPGIIVLFVSRLFRGQARRREREEEQEAEPVAVEAPRQRPQPPPPRTPAPEPAPEPEPVVAESSEEILRGIFTAAEQLEDSIESDPSEFIPGEDTMASPKSSAEMIAEARQRWNNRP